MVLQQTTSFKDSDLAHVKVLVASDASEQAVLVALDMLVNMAVDSAHPDLLLFQNLRAQVARFQDRLCIRGLCLEVLCDKSNERLSTAHMCPDIHFCLILKWCACTFYGLLRYSEACNRCSNNTNLTL